MPCVGCGNLSRKLAVNLGLRKVMAFCLPCRSKLVHAHRWQEFFRVGREEDLPGYAPNKIGLGIGLTLKERTGTKGRRG